MKALIFDMDGLMINSEKLYIQAEREIAGVYGKTVNSDILARMMGRKPIESIRIFVADLKLPVLPEEILVLRDRKMKEKLKNELEPMEGIFDIIHFFYNRLKLAVATGATGEFLDIVVDQLNLRDKFSVLQASDEIIRGKPNPEIYLKVCEKLTFRPADCIVLEDSGNGVRAGKSAGCYTIAVPSEYTEDQDFGLADFVADNLRDAQSHIAVMLDLI